MIQNIILFQLGWFACVMGGASAYPWLGSVVVIGILALHLLQASVASHELKLILYVAIIGTAWDSLLTTSGLMQFQTGIFIDGVAPHWLIAMWALFATTLNVSMRWLRQRVLLSSLLGLIGGPVAYYAGHKLGAVEFSDPVLTLVFIAIGWSFIMPLLSLLGKKNDGYLLEKKQPVQHHGATA